MKEMFKIAAKVSYLGSPYLGFQRQSKGITVQGKLEEVLSVLMDYPTEIKAAGRTDAGVSAKGQVIAFLSDRKLDLDRFKMQANRLLPPTIAIEKMLEVPLSFDPRHSCKGKEYIYRFYYGEKDPFKANEYGYFREDGFDKETFAKALSLFRGEHDFSNFTSKDSDKDNFIRNIEKLEVCFDEEKKSGSILFLSNGFMTYQIRYMVGEAYMTSRGKHSLEELQYMLERKPRKVVGAKAPAEGLCLNRVIYDEKLGL